MNVAGGAAVESVLCACDRSTRTYRDGFQVETSSVTQVNLVNGVRGILLTGDHLRSNGERGDLTFRLVGTRGVIEFWGWQDQYRVSSPKCPGELFDAQESEATAHQRHLESLLPQLASGKCDYSMAETSLAALEAVEAAYLSARHGCEVRFPLASFQPKRVDDWDPGAVYSGTGGGVDGRTI